MLSLSFVVLVVVFSSCLVALRPLLVFSLLMLLFVNIVVIFCCFFVLFFLSLVGFYLFLVDLVQHLPLVVHVLVHHVLPHVDVLAANLVWPAWQFQNPLVRCDPLLPPSLLWMVGA